MSRLPIRAETAKVPVREAVPGNATPGGGRVSEAPRGATVVETSFADSAVAGRPKDGSPRPVSAPAPATGQGGAPAPRPAQAAAGPRAWSAVRPTILGIVALLVLVGGFGTWAATTNIAGAIISTGQIEVDRNRQVVQHPDGGVVETILVDEGDRVEAGDILIGLDATLLRSRLTTAESQIQELQARRGRLEAERDGADKIIFPTELVATALVDPQAAALMDGQQRLFEARATTIQRSVEQLRGRSLQITRQIEGITAQQAALDSQLTFIAKELEDQQSLLDRGLAQASRVSALQREDASLRGTAGELLADAGEASERIAEVEIEILKLDSTRREEAITQLRDLQFRELEFVETRNSLREQLSRLDIRAPVSGIVYGLTVFAERSVIRPADPLLYIVPQDRPLVIAVRVEPNNIDQVRVGQDVTLRFSAFDSRTTPELFGEVLQVSADAFTDERAGASFYRAEIRLKEGEIEKMPEDLALIPGMPVEAFIRTADRTPIAYLVKPLADYFTKAFREG